MRINLIKDYYSLSKKEHSLETNPETINYQAIRKQIRKIHKRMKKTNNKDQVRSLKTNRMKTTMMMTVISEV